MLLPNDSHHHALTQFEYQSVFDSENASQINQVKHKTKFNLGSLCLSSYSLIFNSPVNKISSLIYFFVDLFITTEKAIGIKYYRSSILPKSPLPFIRHE